MSNHISDSLYGCCHVMSSDLDQPNLMEILVGITCFDELVVSVDWHDSEDPSRNCSTAAIVNKEDAEQMAVRHGVGYWDLPLFIARCMNEWDNIINPTYDRVVDCFKEITECLLDEGCRFRIKRTCGRGGRHCC